VYGALRASDDNTCKDLGMVMGIHTFWRMKSGRGAKTRLMSRTKRSTEMRVGVASTELAP
jgi:hypothetical protein